MKILHVTQRYWPCGGGAERYMQEIGERLVRDGHDVTVYTTDAFDLELFWRPGFRRIEDLEEEHNGVLIRRFPVRHLPLPFPLTLGLNFVPGRTFDLTYHHPSPWVPDLLRAPAGDFDVVHTTALPYNSILYAGYLIARRSGARLICTPHLHFGEGSGSWRMLASYARPAQMWLVGQSDAVIARTAREARVLASRGVPADRISAIGGAFNPAELVGGDGGRFRTRYGLPGDEPIVFCVGMKAFNKGTQHTVKAMHRLWNRGRRAKLVLAGASQPDFRRFWSRQSSIVRERTLLLDYVSDEDKRDLFAAGDVLAMPSRSDTFGVVFLEAWYYAKPVVGALAGGIPDVIDTGSDGCVVAFGDVGALAERLAALLDDAELRRRLGEAGQRKVLQKWTWDTVYEQLRGQYESPRAPTASGAWAIIPNQ
jgi:glycosyltransferase involved in cell wall biosynthesis